MSYDDQSDVDSLNQSYLAPDASNSFFGSDQSSDSLYPATSHLDVSPSHEASTVPFNEIVPAPVQSVNIDSSRVHTQDFMPLMGDNPHNQSAPTPTVGIVMQADYAPQVAAPPTKKSPFLGFAQTSGERPLPVDFMNFMRRAQNGLSREVRPFWEAPGPVATDVMQHFASRKDWLQDNVDKVFGEIQQAKAPQPSHGLRHSLMPSPTIQHNDQRKPVLPSHAAIHAQKTSNMWSMPLR